MADATFRHGNPVMIDYTASADIDEGDVVLLGEVTANTTGTGAVACIAHKSIANGVQDALAAGGGVYDMVNLNNAANGAKVWWDGTSKVTTTGTNNAVVGFVVANGGGGANSTCRVLHKPYA